MTFVNFYAVGDLAQIELLINVAIERTSMRGNVTVLSQQEQARNDVMSYIKVAHSQTAQYMQSFNWTGGKVNTTLLGSETYKYTSGGWTVTEQYPVVPNPVYTVNVTYATSATATPIVMWTGTWQNGTVKENSFTFNSTTPTPTPTPTPSSAPSPTSAPTSAPSPSPLMQEQARNDVMNYIKTAHNQTASYMQNLSWTGGRVNTSLVGSETYTYQSGGWNLTEQYPVVPNPIFTVNVTYLTAGASTPLISWRGTWQNGTVTETSFSTTIVTPTMTPTSTSTPTQSMSPTTSPSASP
jgi:hypothetical protein